MYDGVLCLGGVPENIDKADIMDALAPYGAIDLCAAPKDATTLASAERESGLWIIKFLEHESAKKAVDAAPKIKDLCQYAFIAFNDRPYDELTSGGKARGW